MKIPQNLRQFPHRGALFLASGEYEAKFYLALNGEINLINTLKIPSREKAREKQAFVGTKGGRYGLAAVSNKGRYIENLKKKFIHKVYNLIHDVISKYDLTEIYLFSPRFFSTRIIEKLNKNERKKVKLKTFGEFVRKSPLEMIKILRQHEKKSSELTLIPKEEAKKILNKKI